MPQLRASALGSTQDCPHSNRLGAQPSVMGRQLPWLQTWSAEQNIPQPPQLPGLLLVLTHTPLQTVSPAAQGTPPAPTARLDSGPASFEQDASANVANQQIATRSASASVPHPGEQ